MTTAESPFNFDDMTPAEFEERLPELFSAANGKLSDDPKISAFLDRNPTCAALVHDLEYIAEAARSILEPTVEEPSDNVWSQIQSKLKIAGSET